MVLRRGREIRGRSLEDAVWMIGAYLAVASVLGYVISLFRDLFARRERKEARKGAEAAG